MQRCMDSWGRAMPDYEIKCWDLSNSPLDNEYARVACARELWSPLSNYVRLHALYSEGGIYLDTDVETLKSFTPLLNDRCFLGFQQVPEQGDWTNTAVLAAEPAHDFIKECMERHLSVFESTGRFERSPLNTTRVLRAWGLRRYGFQTIHGVTIYPVEYFYPYSWLEKYSASRITDHTYCVHYWVNGWKKNASLELPAPVKRFRASASSWIRGHWRDAFGR